MIVAITELEPATGPARGRAPGSCILCGSRGLYDGINPETRCCADCDRRTGVATPVVPDWPALRLLALHVVQQAKTDVATMLVPRHGQVVQYAITGTDARDFLRRRIHDDGWGDILGEYLTAEARFEFEQFCQGQKVRVRPGPARGPRAAPA